MGQGSIFVNLKDLKPEEQALANESAKLMQIASWVSQMPYSITVFPEGKTPTKESGRCGNVLSARDLARIYISNSARNGRISHLLGATV